MPVLWYGDKVLTEVEQKTQRGLRRAATWMVREIKQSLNVQGARLGGKTKGRARYVASKKGEPPHRQLGGLKRSIDYIETPMSVRVGTGVDYGLYLEVGTKKMAKRPFLRPMIDNAGNQKKIAELVARG